MLELTIPESEMFDEDKNEFVIGDAVVLRLEHSLSSLSKWESKWEKPFLGKENKSTEETLDYVNAMSLDGPIPPDVLSRIDNECAKQISDYIGAKHSATWFKEDSRQVGPRETVTAEIIYHWMIALNIPSEYETWHLTRLLTLVRVINEKNKQADGSSKKKMSRSELAARNRELNAQRRQQLGTSG